MDKDASRRQVGDFYDKTIVFVDFYYIVVSMKDGDKPQDVHDVCMNFDLCKFLRELVVRGNLRYIVVVSERSYTASDGKRDIASKLNGIATILRTYLNMALPHVADKVDVRGFCGKPADEQVQPTTPLLTILTQSIISGFCRGNILVISSSNENNKVANCLDVEYLKTSELC